MKKFSIDWAAEGAVEMATITKAEYEELLERDQWLSCLEAAGVDNWGGYSLAHEFMEDEEE